MSTTEEKPVVKQSRWKWLFPVGLVALASAGVAVVWNWPAPELSRMIRVNWTMGIMSFTILVLIIWSFLFARRFLWVVLGMVAAGSIAAWASGIRVKFDGDLVYSSWYIPWLASYAEVVDSTPVEIREPTAVDWPGYRGAKRDGVVDGPKLSRDWEKQPPKLLWRVDVGEGHASFAVVGNVAITIEQRGDEEAIVCYDVEKRGARWVHSYPARFVEPRSGPGPNATPTIYDGDVYSLGATGWLVCLDVKTGTKKWAVNILEDNENVTWGMSGSPLVYDDVVVVNPGVQTESARGKGALRAYARTDGTLKWASGNSKAGYSSPMLATLAGRRQVLIFDAAGLGGYDAETGAELWRYPWTTPYDINVAQPLVLDGDRVFISSGYGVGCAMLRVQHRNGDWRVEQLWRNRKMRCKFTSPVVYNNHIYGLDDGRLVCLDPETGERKWRGNMYGHGQLLRTGDLLVIQAERGDLALVLASPDKFQQLGRIEALSSRTWNYPALANGIVFLRNEEEMCWFDLRGE